MNKQQQKLFDLHNAYRRMYLTEDGKLTPDAELVLKDMMIFGRWWKSVTMISPTTRQVDPYATMQAEGRREMLQRIMERIYVDDSVLFRLYHSKDKDYADD